MCLETYGLEIYVQKYTCDTNLYLFIKTILRNSRN